MPTTKTKPRRRDQSGYTAPTRVNKAGMYCAVDPDIRRQFNEVAASLNLTANDLLRHLVETTVERGTDPALKAAIENEQQRIDAVRLAALSRITGKPSPT